MRYIGIDPGSTPTIAVTDGDGAVRFYEQEAVGFAYPRVGRTGKVTEALATAPELVVSALKEALHPAGETLPIPHLIVLERVSMRPDENIATGQRFIGCMYQIVGICVALGYNWRAPTPAVWKKALGVPGKLHNDANDLIRRAAVQEFPQSAALFRRKLDHNRAEAALLAVWGQRFGQAFPKGMGNQ